MSPAIELSPRDHVVGAGAPTTNPSCRPAGRIGSRAADRQAHGHEERVRRAGSSCSASRTSIGCSPLARTADRSSKWAEVEDPTLAAALSRLLVEPKTRLTTDAPTSWTASTSGCPGTGCQARRPVPRPRARCLEPGRPRLPASAGPDGPAADPAIDGWFPSTRFSGQTRELGFRIWSSSPAFCPACDRVREWEVGVDRVVVAAAVSVACDVTGVGELGDDSMRGPFGDPDALADVAQANAGVTGDADQHLGVVGEKCPTRCRVRVLSHLSEHIISRLIFHAMIVRHLREDPKIPSHARGGPKMLSNTGSSAGQLQGSRSDYRDGQRLGERSTAPRCAEHGSRAGSRRGSKRRRDTRRALSPQGAQGPTSRLRDRSSRARRGADRTRRV